MLYGNRNPIRVSGIFARVIQAALFIEHPIEGVVLLLPRQKAEMPGDLRVDGGPHEVVIGLGFEADGGAKAIVLGFHDREERVPKVSGRNLLHQTPRGPIEYNSVGLVSLPW